MSDDELAILEPEILKLFIDLSPANRIELLARMILFCEEANKCS